MILLIKKQNYNIYLSYRIIDSFVIELFMNQGRLFPIVESAHLYIKQG